MSKPAAMKWRAMPAVAGAAALSMVLSWPGAVDAQADTTAEPMRTVAVSAVGTSEVEPDEAVVRVGVTARAAGAKAASRRAATRMDSVLAALRDLGIDEADIRTTQLELRPYRRRDRQSDEVVSGWLVENKVRVTLRDIAITGEVIDAAIAAGANDIEGVRFRASDSSVARGEARSAAVAAAEAAARELADAAGVEVLGVLSMVEGSAGSVPTSYRLYAAESVALAASTPIEPGTIDVAVTVTAVYEIG